MIQHALSRLFKGSLVYGVGAMLQRFIGLLLLPFYTRVLQPEDYGVLALISLIGVAMSGFLSLGTGNSMSIIYFREGYAESRNKVLWTNFSLMVINSLLMFFLVFLFAPHISKLIFQTPDYYKLIRVSFLGTALVNISETWLSYLRMEEKAKAYVFITLCTALLTIGLSVVAVLGLDMGLRGLFLATTTGQALVLLSLIFFVARKVPFGFSVNYVKPLVRIGFPSIFGLLAFMLIDYADRQMIERILGLSSLGIYSIGYGFGMLITIPVGAFSSAWPPFYMSFISKQEEAKQVFAKVLTYYSLTFGAVTTLFFAFAKPVVLALTAQKFHEAWVVVGLVAAAYVLKGCYLIFLPGLSFAEKLGKQSAIEWVAAFVNLGANVLLIPVYGIMGAALATLLSYLILPVLAWYLSNKYLEVQYEWVRLFKVLALISLFCILVFQLPVWIDLSIQNLVILNMLLTALAFFIGYFGILNMSERRFLMGRFNL